MVVEELVGMTWGLQELGFVVLEKKSDEAAIKREESLAMLSPKKYFKDEEHTEMCNGRKSFCCGTERGEWKEKEGRKIKWRESDGERAGGGL